MLLETHLIVQYINIYLPKMFMTFKCVVRQKHANIFISLTYITPYIIYTTSNWTDSIQLSNNRCHNFSCLLHPIYMTFFYLSCMYVSNVANQTFFTSLVENYLKKKKAIVCKKCFYLVTRINNTKLSVYM